MGEIGGSQPLANTPTTMTSMTTPAPKPSTKHFTPVPQKGCHLLPPRIEEAFIHIEAWHLAGDNASDENYNSGYEEFLHSGLGNMTLVP